MRVAIWDTLPAAFVASGAASGAVEVPFALSRHRPEVCTALLLGDEVDAALVPTTLALKASDGFDVIPGVGLVAWRYPYARLVWPGGLGDLPQTVAHDRRALQEPFVARVVMQEHYGHAPALHGYDAPSVRALLAKPEDAALLTGPEAATFDADGDRLVVDIGREWYELTNYPMVWGLFVTKRGRATNALIDGLVAMRRASEAGRAAWIEAQDLPPGLEAFFRDDLRSALDKLAVASLTELRQYLFYYGETEEVPDLPFVYLDKDEGDGAPAPRDGTV